MAVPFPYPDNNLSSLFGFMQYANTLVSPDGFAWLGVMILVIVYFVSFLSTKNFSTERAFGFSTFLGFIVALLLRFLGLINDNIFAISVILLVISIIMLMRERNVEEFGV